jgi:hypothetical protein
LNSNNEVPKKQTLLDKISIGIAITLVIVICNEFIQVIPTHKTKLEGVLLLSPLLIAPIGLILGLISTIKDRTFLAMWGTIINSILYFSPFFIGH